MEKSTIEVKPGSEKSFGYVFSIFFTIIGLNPLLADESVRVWILIASGLTLLITFVCPTIFGKSNYLWFRLEMLLGALVAPVVMGFFLLSLCVPLGLVVRILEKDILRTKIDKQATT